MAGFGDQAQTSQDSQQTAQVSTDFQASALRRIESASSPILTGGLQGCLGIRHFEPPRHRPSDIPAHLGMPIVRHASPEAQEFARNPLNQRAVAGILQRHTRFEGGEMVVDALGAQAEFDQQIGNRLNQEDKVRVFRYLLLLYMNETRDVGSQMANHGASTGNVAEQNMGLSMGNATSLAAGETGLAAVVPSQTAFLNSAGQGLTQQQQEDMLRAAQDLGFSAASIFSAATTLGIGGNNSVTETAQQMTVMDMLRQRAIDRTNELSTTLRKLSDDRESEEYMRTYRNLSIFVGGNARASEVVANNSDPVIQAAVDGQILRARLDAGDMSVVPSRTRLA